MGTLRADTTPSTNHPRAWAYVAGLFVVAAAWHTLAPGAPALSQQQQQQQPAAASAAVSTNHMPFGAFAFEVHGRVQGVYFRKFTVEKAQALQLVGWCANSARGTVVGEVQGPQEGLQHLKEWLSTEGSPQSHIERCDIKQERNMAQLEYKTFERRADVP